MKSDAHDPRPAEPAGEIPADERLRDWCAEVAPQLDAQLGRAEARFRAALRTGEIPATPEPVRPPALKLRPAVSPFARRLSWAAMAAAVLVIVAGVARRMSDGAPDPDSLRQALTPVSPAGPVVEAPEHRPPAGTNSNPNAVSAAPAAFRLEKDVVWQTADDGTIRLEDGSTVRRLRRVRVEYIRRLAQNDEVEWQMLVPHEQVYLVPVTTY